MPAPGVRDQRDHDWDHADQRRDHASWLGPPDPAPPWCGASAPEPPAWARPESLECWVGDDIPSSPDRPSWAWCVMLASVPSGGQSAHLSAAHTTARPSGNPCQTVVFASAAANLGEGSRTLRRRRGLSMENPTIFRHERDPPFGRTRARCRTNGHRHPSERYPWPFSGTRTQRPTCHAVTTTPRAVRSDRAALRCAALGVAKAARTMCSEAGAGPAERRT
jgi:hypothetical protein